MSATRTLTDKPIARETLYEDGTNEVVKVVIDATGGTHTLTFGGSTTAAISATASAATVQTALLAIDSIDAGEVSVTGGPGNSGGANPYFIEFTGALGEQNVGAVTGSGASLTGGAGTQTITVDTPGDSGRVVARHLSDVVTDPESEDAVQGVSASEYPSANQTEADPLAEHAEQSPADVFSDN